MIRKIKQTSELNGDRMPQAFGRWFSNLYFSGINNVLISDGSGDGKVDLFVECKKGTSLKYHILNTKFTNEYDKSSPVAFYDEITRFWQAFENKSNRVTYLNEVVRNDLKPHYQKLFKSYDSGNADLFFVTNHRINTKQFETVKKLPVKIFHLDDVLQYLIDHIEGAMPETDPIILSGISNVLTPSTVETEVPTSIIFARLIDFINYMEDDPFELLFARNVRLWLGNTETNKEIQNTFKNSPKEFAYSNNGITILCKKHTHDPGKQELTIINPRVVNGSQTLHSIQNVDKPSKDARVMVRIIEVPHVENHDIPSRIQKRKEVIHKISIRSNMQNPIKKWNLVSTDDFQNELAKYFWNKGYYYERRQNEWKFRKLELKSLKISQGIDIRLMSQLIASYHYNKKYLGPAIARGHLNELFEENSYSIIRETDHELAYQLFLLNRVILKALNELKRKKKYIANLVGPINFSLFSYICKIFNDVKVKWSEDVFTVFLENEIKDMNGKWLRILKESIVFRFIESGTKLR